MGIASPKLTWCVVRLGEDLNWWVNEISDEIHWDLDGLSIIDPRQMAHILELIDPLRDYGFKPDVLEAAFFPFLIQEDLGKGSIKLKRVNDTFFESEEQLFGLPDIMDEEKGPYADFLDHITRLRIKLLNDLIEFEQNVTVEELEEEIRESQNADYMEGRAVHVFDEICAILEYLPEGYEVDFEDDEKETKSAAPEDQLDDDFPDIEDETIEEDETMKWDEEEEEDDFDEEENTSPPDEDDDLSLDDLDEEEENTKGRRKKS